MDGFSVQLFGPCLQHFCKAFYKLQAFIKQRQEAIYFFYFFLLLQNKLYCMHVVWYIRHDVKTHILANFASSGKATW